MNSVAFILNTAYAPRSLKRIRAFINRGYNVKVYAYDRGVSTKNKPLDFNITIVGDSPESLSYIKRIPVILAGLFRIKRELKGSKVLLYTIGLDVSFFSRFLFRGPFVYEEADLVHTYFRNHYISRIFEYIDKKIIKQSLLTVLTSEGFVRYHFSRPPKNVIVIPNKLSPRILEFPIESNRAINLKNLQVGYVGGFRFNSIYHFTKYFVENYPEHDLHVFGLLDENKYTDELLKYNNFHYHGVFKNPDDLPSIYSKIDLVLCTYDTTFENIRYAEPNKIYEAIYFMKPIIVSKDTFLSEKVNKLGIGFSIDPFNNVDISNFIDNLSVEIMIEKSNNARRLGQNYAIDDNEEIFNKLQLLLNK